MAKKKKTWQHYTGASEYVGFRLTVGEVQQVDRRVAEEGLKTRSAYFKWLLRRDQDPTLAARLERLA